MVTLLKLGGSLITDKRTKQHFRQDVMQRIAREIQSAIASQPSQVLVIGHGSGSFGHFEAKQHNTIDGVHTPEEWIGFSRVAIIAAQLNALVASNLMEAGIPVMRFQPSASVLATDGLVTDMATQNIEQALQEQLVPLVYGDVAFDRVRGGTITSTESIFQYLASALPVTRIILCGEVDGVYDKNGKVVESITPDTFADLQQAIQGAEGVDVTGGMQSKLRDMITLVRLYPALQVQIINGIVPGRIEQALIGESVIGTTIRHLGD